MKWIIPAVLILAGCQSVKPTIADCSDYRTLTYFEVYQSGSSSQKEGLICVVRERREPRPR